MLKTLLTSTLMVGLLTAIGILIPNPMVAAIDSAIVFFLTYIHYTGILLNPDTVFICLKILVNFFLFLFLFIGARWIFKSTTN